MKIIYLISLIISFILIFYTIFKSKQSGGATFMNSLLTNFGFGSFSVAVINWFASLFWGIACIASIFATFYFVGKLLDIGNEGASSLVTTHNQISNVNKQTTTPTIKEFEVEKNNESLPQSNATNQEYIGDDPIVRERLGLPPKN